MRIVSGTLKGRRIIAPKQLPARPTTDYAKEALFNILQPSFDWPETTVLDLFCGIGSISLEALSRGAKHVDAIDAHAGTVRWLSKTVRQLEVNDRINLRKADVFRWLKGKQISDYDLVFADPPYEGIDHTTLIDTIVSLDGFNGSLFVLEHRQKQSFEEHPNFADQRTYGEVRFSFFR